MKYYKPAGTYTTLPCFIETSLEWPGRVHITFDRILKSEYADYSPAEITIPAELSPRILADGASIATNKSVPAYRLRYDGSKAYIPLINAYDEVYCHAVCPVKK